MQKTCPVCSTIFYTRHKETKTCSKKCGGVLRRTQPDSVCEYCGKIFRGAADGNNQTAKFCSRACYDMFRTESRNLCLNCGKRVKGGGNKGGYKYCSQKCKVEHLKPNHRPCINCGTVFTPVKYHKAQNRYSAYNAGKTCSAKCENEWIRNNPHRKEKISIALSGVNHPNWQGGKSAINITDHRGPGWVKIADKVRKRDNYLCRHCGKTAEQNGREMDVHHIVPYHDLNDVKKANRMSNLISLCQSCHKKEENKLQYQQTVLPFAIIAQADRRAARAII